MQKNLVFISTDKQCRNLTTLLDTLATNGYNIIVLASENGLRPKTENSWQHKKLPAALKIDGTLTGYIFLLLSPLLVLGNLLTVLWLRYKYNAHKFICLGTWEKICLGPSARILGFIPFWIECPGMRYRSLGWPLRSALRLSSKSANIIIYNEHTRNELMSVKIDAPRLGRIEPAINIVDFRIQDNIFSQLAETDQRAKHRKFFTVGTVVNLNEKQKIEILFQAGKKCLSVIPDLQIIIIGEGAEKKNLSWLAKKMGIENMVWFVGEQQLLNKWFESMDVFVSTDSHIDLGKIMTVIRSMAAGVPVICRDEQGLGELIEDHISGLLLESDDSEALAQAIIGLNQNRELRRRIGRQAQEIAKNRFSTIKQAEKFAAIINN